LVPRRQGLCWEVYEASVPARRMIDPPSLLGNLLATRTIASVPF
jgi:hypothetical protein